MATVAFGDNNAVDVVVVDGTTITATAPEADASGPVDVTVTTDAGTSDITPAGIFTYDDPATNPAPTVTGLSAGTGPAAGGTTVVITGTGFVDVSGVSFGAFAADPLITTVDSPTQITCVSPPGTGTVDVAVTNDGGTSPLDPPATTFVYTSPPAPPSVSDVAPAKGDINGGDTVTLTGIGFTDALAVSFGPVDCDPTTIIVFSDTLLTCASPAQTNPGTVDVRVRNTAGSSDISSDATFTVTSLAPVMAIVAITLADGTVVNGSDLLGPIHCNGTISVAWSGVDDIDTVLTSTYIARAHGPKIADGAPAFGGYGASFATALLGDGTHPIEADGTDSETNLGRSAPVTLIVNNGASAGGPAVKQNPDFEHRNPTPSIGETVHAAVAQHAPAVAHLGPIVDPIVAQLDENARHQEDWLNRNVVRRLQDANELGDGTTYNDTAWQEVTPAISSTVAKAQQHSKLVVVLGCTGYCRDPDPGSHWVDLGVHIIGPQGYDALLRIARNTIDYDKQHLTHAAVQSVGYDLPKGTYLLRLVVRVLTPTTSWASSTIATLSMSVTEAPGP